MNSTTVLAEAPELVQPVASGWQLVLAFLAGIAMIVVLDIRFPAKRAVAPQT